MSTKLIVTDYFGEGRRVSQTEGCLYGVPIKERIWGKTFLRIHARFGVKDCGPYCERFVGEIALAGEGDQDLIDAFNAFVEGNKERVDEKAEEVKRSVLSRTHWLGRMPKR